ncbi:hypothetical protein B566_EDAN006526, partial [Ephemera danica]
MANLKYLDRFMKESLRLYPSICFFERATVTPFLLLAVSTLLYYIMIPKFTLTLISANLINSYLRIAR